MTKHWTHPVQNHAGEKIAELLINNGADINHEDNDESKPCDEAGKPKMLLFLILFDETKKCEFDS